MQKQTQEIYILYLFDVPLWNWKHAQPKILKPKFWHIFYSGFTIIIGGWVQKFWEKGETSFFCNLLSRSLWAWFLFVFCFHTIVEVWRQEQIWAARCKVFQIQMFLKFHFYHGVVVFTSGKSLSFWGRSFFIISLNFPADSWQTSTVRPRESGILVWGANISSGRGQLRRFW